MPENPVLIIGAGPAGLCSALRLQERHVPFRILEASDGPGGRVRTDSVKGFLLDRGFQVLLTAYPEAKHVLDYYALNLQKFESGAIVYTARGAQKIADPVRAPFAAVPGAFSSIGTLADKIRVVALRNHVMRGSLQSVLSNPETSTLERLREFGFTEDVIDCFFRPFLGGIFLESELTTSSRKFEFVFRMFSEGKAALPAAGMQAIPDQLAARLPAGCISYNTRATALAENGVHTADGEFIAGEKIIVAVDQQAAMRLLGRSSEIHAHGTACLYFDAPSAPVRGAWLLLNGQGYGPINNLCVLSEIAPGYAPPGRSLISVSIKGDPPASDAVVERLARQQLQQWFGSVDNWQHLRTYRIPHAILAQPEGALSPIAKPARLNSSVFLCGDHMDIACLNGALLSGRRAADAVLA